MRWLGVLAMLVACSSERVPHRDPAPTPVRTPSLVPGDSNIARADYIGPEACGECHAPQYALWSASLHRVMNARASDAGAVIGDFSGKTLAVGEGTAKFERTLEGLAMVAARGGDTVRYRVTRTIGHRGLQEYVGIEDGHTDEVRLPFGWWPRAGGWVAQDAFDPWLADTKFDPFAPVREPWAERCPWCHSTYPFAQRIARGSGPHKVGHGLEQFFTSQPGTDRLAVDEQVTTGISCESCHLGGRAHAAGAAISAIPAGRDITRVADAPVFPTTFATQRKDPAVVNAICAQCHSGPSPRLSDGTALRNSSEALDLAASPCTTIKCTDCHDPHVANSRDDEPRALAACVKCHDQLASPNAARAHAGPGHATTNCLDCHMPRMVMGIDRYVRTHRISSPTNPALLSDAAPNACNLCHLDRSLSWTAEELRRGWSTRLPAKLHATDTGTAVGDLWLASPSPAIRLIAAQAYARSSLAPYVRGKLVDATRDPLPYVRAWMRFALERTAK